MKQIILCGHTGSYNRGCEAIIRSTCELFKKNLNNIDSVALATHALEEDKNNKVVELFDKIYEYEKLKRFSAKYFSYKFYELIDKSNYLAQSIIQKNIWNKCTNNSIVFNVGGDTYCYDFKPTISYALNNYCFKKNIKSIFWGCSLEKDKINYDMMEDLKKYTLICPRESISYNTLISMGINKEKISLMRDPAFMLNKKSIPLSERFIENNTVGLNLSPIVMESAQDNMIAFKNYENLIEKILRETNMNIALIPHVYASYNLQDLEPLNRLFEKYKYTNRIILFKESYNCMELKYIISKCRFMVVARTHASIAAYSSNVPTLVLGYSVKARGIARDLFGNEEGYVLPVQNLKNPNELTRLFFNIVKEEDKIRNHLKSILPIYCNEITNTLERINNFL